jgi:hypothetical protein
MPRMNDKRLAAMIERMTATRERPPRDPAQLVALARKGYAPAIQILKIRAERCPQHRAALDALRREAAGTPAPVAPAPRREQWVATAPPRPAAATPKPAEPITVSPGEFRRMSGHDRGLFIAAGGTVAAETMTRAQFNKLTPSARLKFINDGGKLTN